MIQSRLEYLLEECLGGCGIGDVSGCMAEKFFRGVPDFVYVAPGNGFPGN